MYGGNGDDSIITHAGDDLLVAARETTRSTPAKAMTA